MPIAIKGPPPSTAGTKAAPANGSKKQSGLRPKNGRTAKSAKADNRAKSKK